MAKKASFKVHDRSNFKLIVMSLLFIILAMSVRMMVLGHDLTLLTQMR